MKEGKLEVGWDDEAAEFSYHDPHGGRALLELLPTPSWRTSVPPVSVPRWYAVAGPAYIAVLLAVDTQVESSAQLALECRDVGSSLPLRSGGLATIVRAQVIGVVLFATVAEVTGSLIWGVYRYRLHNLPLFIPPAHGLVYLSGPSRSPR